MWDNARSLNRLSDLLFAAAALMILYAVVRFAIHQPVFALHELRVVGAPGYVTTDQVKAITQRDFHGTFFTLDIVRLRAAFEKLPWIRKVDVRRQWPDRIDVVIEVHQPLAHWGKTALVNAQGEVFEAALDKPGVKDLVLPVFSGPDGASAEIAVQYAAFRREFAAIGREPVQVRLSPRGAWQVRLDNGMVLEIGREQVPARIARFLAAYPQTITALERRIDYVDLRYANGFAVRVPELSQAKSPALRAAPLPRAAARPRA